MKVTSEQMKGTGGNLMELASIDDSHRASRHLLIKNFRVEYCKHSKGGTSFPADFKCKLIAGFEDSAMKFVKLQQTKQIAKMEKARRQARSKR